MDMTQRIFGEEVAELFNDVGRFKVNSIAEAKLISDGQQGPPDFYPSRLFTEVCLQPSFRAASRTTGIPIKSVIYTYRKYQKELKAHVIDQLFNPPPQP